MNKSVLVNTYIYKTTKVDNISYCSLQHHTGLKILHIKDITSENRSRHVLTRVTRRLLELA